MRGARGGGDEDDRRGARGGTPERLDAAARALVALRYYQRFLDEVAAHEERALAGGDHG